MKTWVIDYELVTKWTKENRTSNGAIAWPEWWINREFIIDGVNVYREEGRLLKNTVVGEINKK